MVSPGILLVDKPGGLTSHDVVARTRRVFGTRKVGHAGTLDPMATGLLVIGVEGATRLLTYIVGADKTYTATIRLGDKSSKYERGQVVWITVGFRHSPREKIFTALAELLETTTVPLFIEVKVAGAGEAVAGQLAALPEDSPAKVSTVISFHAEALEAIRRGSPGTPVSYLVEQITEQTIRTAKDLGAAGIGPAIDGLALRAARAVHEAGLRLNPWTVNTAAQLEVALACGVDTITTDDPAWVQRELDVRA